MNKFKNLFILLICFILLLLTAGCGNNTDDAYIYFELPEVPFTLDPQVASSDTELLIIKNIYEGLLRKDKDGKITLGAAESYKADGLSYTFKIRESAKWSSGDSVTAHDFVFALRRAVNPKTKSPFVSRILSIKNAQEIQSGKMSVDKLGVSATDDKTLVITLKHKDENFENALTTSIAMPCREKLFNESAGKYGMFSDYIISNGSYRLTKWNKSSFGIRLYRHEEYTGKFYAKNAAIFFTCNDNEHVTEKLKKNSIDIAFIDCALADNMEKEGLKTVNVQNICWLMTINKDFSHGMRNALSKLVGAQVYSDSLDNGYTAANSIYPSVITDTPPADGLTIYNLESGKNQYLKELEYFKDKKFPTDIILYYYDDGYIKPVVTDIVGHWQSNLSAFVNIESASSSELLSPELQNQTLSMAIFPIRADSDNPTEYLKKFGVKYNGESLGNMQKSILKDNTVIPLFFQNTCIAYSAAITNLSSTDGDGYIDFSFIVKYE